MLVLPLVILDCLLVLVDVFVWLVLACGDGGLFGVWWFDLAFVHALLW